MTALRKCYELKRTFEIYKVSVAQFADFLSVFELNHNFLD